MPKFSSGQILTADYLNAFDMKVGRQDPATILKSSGNDRVYIHTDGRIFSEKSGVWIEQISNDPAAHVAGFRSLGTGEEVAASGNHRHQIAQLDDDSLHSELLLAIGTIVGTIGITTDEDGDVVESTLQISSISDREWSVSWTNFNTNKSLLILSSVRLSFRKASNAVDATDLGILLTATYGDTEIFSDDIAVFTNAELISNTVRSQLLTSAGIISEPTSNGIINFDVTGGDALVGGISDGIFKLCEISTG